MATTPDLQAELDRHRRQVDVDAYDITVRELVRLAVDHELEVAPAYQRKFRWTVEDESRLIESVLLGLPVPSLFVATNKDGTWEMVDGLQRVGSLVHFIAEPIDSLSLVHRDRPLVLAGLEKLEGFNGLAYDGLPAAVQLHFQRRPLRVTALSDKSERQTRFDMFERLNRGGISLSPQEVRACIYRGSFADLLRELAANSEFQSLLKLQQGKLDDGTREEQVLKFFAYWKDRDNYDGRVTAFLNRYMEQHQNSFNVDSGRRAFTNAISALAAVVGAPIKRPRYSNTPLVQFEGILVAVAEIQQTESSDLTPREGWLDDAELAKHSTKGTNTRSALRGRIARAKALLQGASPSPRS